MTIKEFQPNKTIGSKSVNCAYLKTNINAEKMNEIYTNKQTNQ